MQEYKGVITGIGDKLTGDNLIQPQLDAYWRDFVVGGNAILSGLELSKPMLSGYLAAGSNGDTANLTIRNIENVPITVQIVIRTNSFSGTVQDSQTITIQANQTYTYKLSDVRANSLYATVTFKYGSASSYEKQLVLTRTPSDSGKLLETGACQALGYLGYSTETITADDTYVYGRFVIKHSDEPDEFYIVTTDHESLRQDDILNEAGEYWLLLYEYGEPNVNLLHYPAGAIHSDESDVLVAGGMIDSDAIAVTQKVGDNSQRVATTQYVTNQIAKEIGADDYPQSATVNLEGMGNTSVTVNIKHKAKMCIMSLSFKSQYSVALQSSRLLITLNKYRPTKAVTAYMGLGSDNASAILCTINPNGQVILNGGYIGTETRTATNIGYETNE